MRLRVCWWVLEWVPAQVLTEGPCWAFSDPRGCLYITESLWDLVRQVVTEWRHDRHMVG